jgi:ZIP family zinc transporter
MNITTIAYLSFLTIFLTSVLGSGMVFFFNKKKEFNSQIINGFTSGVMIGAAILGLLIPSLENSYTIKYLPVILGIILGCIFIYLLDLFLKKAKIKDISCIKLFSALTLHNIPEGLAVGLSFSLALFTKSEAYLISALSLTLGIALQNIPENLSLSLTMTKTINSKIKGFLLGVLSCSVEPLFAILAFYLTLNIESLMPILLSFAAGAMIYITLDEILISNYENKSNRILVWSFVIGFCIMLILENI